MNPIVVTKSSPKSAVSESFRTIRSNIQFSQSDKEIKTLLVTSAGPEEGKTMTCANLAVVFALGGSRVLVIDADLRRPSLHKVMEMSNKAGLTNVLSERKDYKDLLLKTNTTNLHFLPSGPIPPNPSELLGSKSMKSFLEQVKGDFDMVIMDTPPVGAVTDAQVLATLVDGTLLVAASGRAKVDDVKNAKALLKNVNANILGVILNRVKASAKSYEYIYEEGKQEKPVLKIMSIFSKRKKENTGKSIKRK